MSLVKSSSSLVGGNSWDACVGHGEVHESPRFPECSALVGITVVPGRLCPLQAALIWGAGSTWADLGDPRQLLQCEAESGRKSPQI